MIYQEQTFDVIIIGPDRRVDMIAGTSMQMFGGAFNAPRRFEKVKRSLLADESAAIVPAGKYRKGDVYMEARR